MQKQLISENEAQVAKQSYQTPELKALGSVEQLTECPSDDDCGSHICIFSA